MKRYERLNNIFFAIIATILFIITMYLKKTTENENSNILMSPDYSIGVVKGYTGARAEHYSKYYRGDSSPSVKFQFYVKKEKYVNEYSLWKEVPKAGVKIGSKYLVIYLKDDPENCLMLFDKPIKDSTDYIKYLKEIENGKPIEYKFVN